MARYQSYTFTTANQCLMDLSAFVSANGWTIDFDGVYNTTYRRLHIHKGIAHFDLYSTSTTNIRIYGCTGYDSAKAPSLQPNVSAYRDYSNTATYTFWLVSTSGGLFFTTAASTGRFLWGSLFAVTDKIGSWADGIVMSVPPYSASPFSTNWYGSSYGYALMYYESQWSTNGLDAGGLCGGLITSDISTKQPCAYNCGLVPFPIPLFILNGTDYTKKHPVGYVPGVYKCNGGDVYSIADEIIIGGDTYVIFPSNAVDIGGSSVSDMLFRLGA